MNGNGLSNIQGTNLGGTGASPKEGSFLQKTISADEVRDQAVSPGKEVPVRWQS